MTVELPAGLLTLGGRDASWTTWLAELPRLAQGLLDDWSLTSDGAAMHGECALALPVRTAEGRTAVLKVTWPHWEAEHEHLALRHWHGAGAVELLRADPRRLALLLERLHPVDLTGIPVDDACTVIGGLYPRLHRPAVPQLRRLSDVVGSWTERLAALDDVPAPRRLIDRAVGLGRDLAADPATDGRLVHADLHFGNVLAADREPWLAIDPKPLSGDPHAEVAPLMWNRWDEAVDTGDVRGALRRRVDVVCEVAGLDDRRVREWTVVRAMATVLWSVEDARAQHRGLTAADRDGATRAVTVAKAVQ